MSTVTTTRPERPEPEPGRGRGDSRGDGPAPGRVHAEPPVSASLDRPSKVTLPRVVRSEWTKLRSLRSTWVTLALAAALSIGLAAIIGSTLGNPQDGGGGPPPEVAADPTSAILAGTALASLVLGVFGALAASSEYSSGTVRASLTAVPRRLPVLVGKALVLAVVTAVAGGAMTAGSFWLGSSLLSNGLSASWGDAGVVAAIVGNTGYLVAVALLGLGLGWLLRSTPGAITVLVAVVFVVPPLLQFIPWSWVDTASGYFPAVVGQSLRATVEAAQTLSTGTASLTLALWALVPLVAGAVMLVRRDA